MLRRVPATFRRTPVYLLLAEMMIIASLGEWLYSDYQNNQFLQTYLQQVQRTQGTWIDLGIALGLASLPLLLFITKRRWRRFQVAALYGGIVIVTLSSMLYVEYRTNVYMQLYVATHTTQLIEAFLGVAGLYVSAVALTEAGLTRRLTSRIRRDDFLAFVSYTLLTIGFTYPVILHMTDSVPQIGRDVWHVLWDLWWVGTSITSFQSPFQINMILYPTGTNGIFHTWAFTSSLFGIPLQSVLGLVATLNVLFLSSYILSGVNMYALSKYLTKDTASSFIAGLVYAFFPQHVVQSLVHLNIMTQQWLPLYALFLLKMIRENRLRNGIYSGLALVLVAFSDFHFLYMALVLTFLLLMYVLWRARDLILNRRFVERLGFMLSTFVLLASPFILSAMPFLVSSGGFSQETLGSVGVNSADLATYFFPAPGNALYVVLSQGFSLSLPFFSHIINVSNRDHFVGYTVLLLAAFALFRARKNGWRGLAPFWGILAVAATILSLGPSLIVLGKATGIPMPYSFLYTYVFQFFPLTFFRSIRAISRFSIVVMLSLSVLVAYAMKDIIEYFERRQSQTRIAQFLGTAQAPRVRVDRARLLSILVVVLILFEFWSAPLPVQDSAIPVYYQIIQQDSNKSNVVLEVPIFQGAQSYLYYQTYHQHILVNGRVARNPAYTFIFSQTTPFIRTLQLNWPKQNTSLLVQSINETQIAPYVLGQYNIKYIVVHRTIRDLNVSSGQALPFERATLIIENLSKTIGSPVYNGTDAALFRFDNESHLDLMKYLQLSSTTSRLLMLLQGNWVNQNSISSSASVEVISAHDTRVQLELVVKSHSIQRILQVQASDDPPAQYLIGPESNLTLVTNPFLLRQGSNLISFTTPQQCTVVSPTNPSCISFSFRSIQIADTPPPST